MLSGSRALEFLGCQGVTALGNLMLSCRDLLLLDVRSTVPAEEVARLCYAALPSSAGLFPSPLLDSALDKMRTASTDTLVQNTLHPPKIPQKSSAGPVKAASTPTSSVDRGHRRRLRRPLPLPSRVGSGKGARVRHPFRLPPAANVVVPGRSPPDRVSRPLRGGGCLSTNWRHWQSYWGRVLGAVHPAGRASHPLLGTSSSPRSHPDIVSYIPVRISSVTGSGPGDREDVGQGCLGDRPRSGSRLLQSSFSGGKGDGRLASRDQPLSPEQVCSANSVQDGDRSLHATFRPGGVFPGFHRPDGCVFPDTHSSVVEEAIEVPVWGRGGGGGDSLPVQGPVLQTVDCPSGLHLS